MILVIDVGNTHIVMGVYQEDTLVDEWRIMSDQHRTGDEYGAILQNLFQPKKIPFDSIKGIIISCVVPPMQPTMEWLCEKFFHVPPLFVGPGVETGIKICYKNPVEVGADRIVNAVAAFEEHKSSLVVIDFGTATTFDYISEKGEYMGGAIAPGIGISSEALFDRTSKLPRVDFACPGKIVADNTVASIQAGIFFGYVSLVGGIVERIKEEVKTDPFVVATGGLASSISSYVPVIDDVDEYLTLKGLKIIYNRNS